MTTNASDFSETVVDTLGVQPDAFNPRIGVVAAAGQLESRHPLLLTEAVRTLANEVASTGGTVHGR